MHLNESYFETEYEREEIGVEINLDFDRIVVSALITLKAVIICLHGNAETR